MPSKYVPKGKTVDGTERRMRAFRHNAMLGHVVNAQKNMINIHNSDTTTSEAQKLASDIYGLLTKLHSALKTRVD